MWLDRRFSKREFSYQMAQEPFYIGTRPQQCDARLMGYRLAKAPGTIFFEKGIHNLRKILKKFETQNPRSDFGLSRGFKNSL